MKPFISALVKSVFAASFLISGGTTYGGGGFTVGIDPDAITLDEAIQQGYVNDRQSAALTLDQVLEYAGYVPVRLNAELISFYESELTRIGGCVQQKVCKEVTLRFPGSVSSTRFVFPQVLRLADSGLDVTISDTAYYSYLDIIRIAQAGILMEKVDTARFNTFELRNLAAAGIAVQLNASTMRQTLGEVALIARGSRPGTVFVSLNNGAGTAAQIQELALAGADVMIDSRINSINKESLLAIARALSGNAEAGSVILEYHGKNPAVAQRFSVRDTEDLRRAGIDVWVVSYPKSIRR